MKKFLLLTVFLLTGCATLQDLSMYHATKFDSPRSYRCLLEADMCSLIENAAAIATVEGHPWYRDDKYGELWWAPGASRSVFWTTNIPAIGNMPLVDPALIPRHYAIERSYNYFIAVNARRGGVDLRDSDLVTLFVDMFEQTPAE